MNQPVAVGTGLQFTRGYGDFLAGRIYAVICIRTNQFLLVEISLKNRSAARILRYLDQAVFQSLALEGSVVPCDLPLIPRISAQRTTEEVLPKRLKWALELKPMVDAAADIFAAHNPARTFNTMARTANLHVSRSRERFFWLAAYGFDDDCLAPAHWNCGRPRNVGSQLNKKAGRKVKDPTITFVGWASDSSWEKPMLDGWNEYAKPGRTYMRIYVDTLRTKFGCLVDKSIRPTRIYHPEGKTYPKYWQFKYFIMKSIGKDAWRAAKFGAQTIRNHDRNASQKASQFLINLLEEVQWDAQELDERPGDILDPTQSGKPIVRVVAICCSCGGPVGVGYDYGAESKWAYLMALLCMAMKKSEFCALFGVEISDEDWPALGVMLSIRGDRGPAIGRKVSDIVASVLEVWQEWSASYDPKGKATAESAHYKKINVEGKPRTPRAYRTPIEIIRDDLRKTVVKFRSAEMSHRLDPDQANRGVPGTPIGIWNDLAKRSLYAGQGVPIHKLIRCTVPSHAVSIAHDGVYLGGIRYLSPVLQRLNILERAKGGSIDARAYALNMSVRNIWLDLNGELLQLTGMPVRINSMDVTHSLTLEESMRYRDQMNRSRRIVDEERRALELELSIEAEKDRRAVEKARKEKPAYKSSGKRETAMQHEEVLRRKT